MGTQGKGPEEGKARRDGGDGGGVRLLPHGPAGVLWDEVRAFVGYVGAGGWSRLLAQVGCKAASRGRQGGREGALRRGGEQGAVRSAGSNDIDTPLKQIVLCRLSQWNIDDKGYRVGVFDNRMAPFEYNLPTQTRGHSGPQYETSVGTAPVPDNTTP